MRRNRFLTVVGIVIAIPAVITLFSAIVMSLWNWLMPQLFGLHAITLWQALGLLVLSKILFGGFRGGPGRHMHWRRRMIERWEQMTPEERAKFQEGMRYRCGSFGKQAPEQQTQQQTSQL